MVNLCSRIRYVGNHVAKNRNPKPEAKYIQNRASMSPLTSRRFHGIRPGEAGTGSIDTLSFRILSSSAVFTEEWVAASSRYHRQKKTDQIRPTLPKIANA